MLRSIDQVAVRESPISLDSGSGMVAYCGTLSSKAQYQPSSLQRVIHSQLVNARVIFGFAIPGYSARVLQLGFRTSWPFHHAVRTCCERKQVGINAQHHRLFQDSVTSYPSDPGSVIDAVDGLAVVVETFIFLI
ncbi:hypothetical protein GQ600_225 [Phytophthora cactorum]|nr:hypothetical protein GQ600_225 [Phytophthora cactorum]